MKHEINLDTMGKINKFVAICSGLDCKVDLIDNCFNYVSFVCTSS